MIEIIYRTFVLVNVDIQTYDSFLWNKKTTSVYTHIGSQESKTLLNFQSSALLMCNHISFAYLQIGLSVKLN